MKHLMILFFYSSFFQLIAQPSISITIEKLNLLEVTLGDEFAEELGEIRALMNRFDTSLDESLIPLINEKYDQLKNALLGFSNYFEITDDTQELESLNLKQLISLRINRIAKSYFGYNAERNKLEELYRYYQRDKRFDDMIVISEPDPLEIFDNDWTIYMVRLDAQILIKRKIYWDELPTNTRRIFEIEEGLATLTTREERLREVIREIMLRCNPMDGPEWCEEQSAPQRAEADSIQLRLQSLEQEKEYITNNLALNQIPKIKEQRDLLYHEIYQEIPVEVLLIN